MENSFHSDVLAKFILGFEGTTLPDELAALLAQGLAGVAIFQRNFTHLEGLRALTTAIRRAAGRPVLIGMDQEGGTRFALPEPFTVWPSPTDLGRLGDARLVERVAQAMAHELRAVGCNLDFAPMLDLEMNPTSPVTLLRSFGADSKKVARLGAAFVRGLRKGSVLACAKHFPGHGDTQVDPHEDLPVFHGTLDRLNRVELVPFAEAIAARVPSIMTAHILLPQIDSEKPASLSRRMLTTILRQQMGFPGVILADDLGMGAISRRFGPGEAAVETFLAGTDVAMLCHDWLAVRPALEATEAALRRHALHPQEWEASHQRIEQMRKATESGAPSEEAPPLQAVGCAEHRAIAAEIRARLLRGQQESTREENA